MGSWRPKTTDPSADYGMLPGWRPIVRDLIADLNEIIPGYKILQVKEKFGTLRFYYTVPQDASEEAKRSAEARVDEAEGLSAKCCEVCGEPSWGPQPSVSGWVYTLCPRHRVENRETGEPAWRMAKI
jgi:hypothetical protein